MMGNKCHVLRKSGQYILNQTCNCKGGIPRHWFYQACFAHINLILMKIVWRQYSRHWTLSIWSGAMIDTMHVRDSVTANPGEWLFYTVVQWNIEWYSKSEFQQRLQTSVSITICQEFCQRITIWDKISLQLPISTAHMENSTCFHETLFLKVDILKCPSNTNAWRSRQHLRTAYFISHDNSSLRNKSCHSTSILRVLCSVSLSLLS